jgi:hypothetical protein
MEEIREKGSIPLPSSSLYRKKTGKYDSAMH